MTITSVTEETMAQQTQFEHVDVNIEAIVPIKLSLVDDEAAFFPNGDYKSEEISEVDGNQLRTFDIQDHGHEHSNISNAIQVNPE